MKHYYAYYCPLGRCCYESLNGNAHTFFRFDSKESRSEWLENHWDMYDCNTYDKFKAVKRADVEEALGKNFRVISHTCFRNSVVLYGIAPYDEIYDFERKFGLLE